MLNFLGRTATVELASDVERRWATDFAARADRHRDVVVTAEEIESAGLTVGTLDRLGRSLATFQLGESGDGDHLRQAAAISGAGSEYRAALASFVREEQEHGRLLAMVLDEMEYPKRTEHWSDRVFVLLRRSKSLRTEILTMLVAEVIALSYYSSMRDGFPVFAEIFGRIHDDGVRHVEFHAETLPSYLAQWSPPVRAGVRFAWNVLVMGSAFVCAADHRKALREAGVSPRDFVVQVHADLRELDWKLFA
ncbi:MAG: ferritin-like domain-containing protein [Actinomycetota bacterium]